MKINELSKSTHTNIETIRYYEKQGVLPSDWLMVIDFMMKRVQSN